MRLQTVLPCLVLLSTVFTIRSSVYTGPARWLTPTSLAALILAAIFGVRPLMMRNAADFDFYGFDASRGFLQAELVGLVSSLAFLGGALWASACTGGKNSLSAPAPDDPTLDVRSRSPIWVATVAVLGAATWLFTVAAFGGLPTLTLLLAGRSQALSHRLAGYPTALLTLALLGSAAACVHIARFARSRRLSRAETIVLTTAVTISAACVSLEGTRRFLLPALLGPVVARIFSNGGRLPRRTLPVIGLLLVFMMTIPFVRSAGARQQGENVLTASWRYYADGGLQDTLRGFFLSYDTEMFNFVAHVSPQLGRTIPYGLGRGTVGEALLFPLPSGALGQQLHSDEVLTGLFGGTCSQVNCPVPSEPGVLLMDFGWLGVLVGMLATGLVLRRFELRAARHGSSTTAVCVIAAIGGYAPVLMRTNTVHALWWTGYFLLAMLLASKSIGALSKRSAGAPMSVPLPRPAPPCERAIVGAQPRRLRWAAGRVGSGDASR